MNKQPWFRRLWAVGHPMIPPIAHSTNSPSPEPSVWPSDILFWTARPHLHPFCQALHFHVLQPKILLIPPVGGRSKISNQDSFLILQTASSQKIWPTIHQDVPDGVHHKPSDQTSFHITKLGSIMKNSRKRPCFDPISHPITDQAKFRHNNLAARRLKIAPNETPSAHPTYHPSYSHTITSCTRPTPTPYHTWALPGRLGVCFGRVDTVTLMM